MLMNLLNKKKNCIFRYRFDQMMSVINAIDIMILIGDNFGQEFESPHFHYTPGLLIGREALTIGWGTLLGVTRFRQIIRGL